MVTLFLLLALQQVPNQDGNEVLVRKWSVMSTFTTQAECYNFRSRVDPRPGVTNLQCVQVKVK